MRDLRKDRKGAPASSASADELHIGELSSHEASEILKEAKKRERAQREFEKRRNRKRKQRASTQNCIRYDAMDPDGVCRIEPGVYSAAVVADNVNYLALLESDQTAAFESWCDFLNTLGGGVGLQIFMHNSLPDPDEISRLLLHESIGAKTDAYREDFNALISSAANGNVLINPEPVTYVFSVQAESKELAATRLHELQKNCVAYCKSLKREARCLSGKERLAQIARCLRPNDVFLFDYAALGRTQTTKDAVSPGYISFPRNSYSASSMLAIEDMYYKTYHMTWVPRNMKDSFIPELFSEGLDAFYGLHIYQYDHEQALKMINDKIKDAEIEKSGVKKKAKRDFEDPEAAQRDELKAALSELKSVKYDLEEDNMNYYSFSLFAVLYGKTKGEIEEAELKMKKVFNKHSYQVSPAATRPIEALNSTMPIGKAWIRAAATGTTNEVGALIPLSGNNIASFKENIFYGVDDVTGAPIFASRRWGLDAPHAMVLGQTGYGKSMGTKGEAEQVRLIAEEEEYRLGRKTKQILMSDPENETKEWVGKSGGTFIEFVDNSGTVINPCDIYVPREKPDQYNPISNKAAFFKGLIGQIYPLKKEAQAVLDAELMPVMREMYRPLESAGWKGDMPTLKDLSYLLSKSSEAEVSRCGKILEPFAEGSYGNFNGQTNVDLSNDLVSFGFKNTNTTSRAPSIYIATNLMWQKLMANHDALMDTWMYFDEFQHQTREQTAKEFFFEVYSRARKFGGIATAMTQTPENVLNDPETRAVIKNCGMVTLYYMLEDDVDVMGKLFNISDGQLDHIRRGLAGTGLYIFNKRAIPFNNKYDEESEIYRLFKTSRKD